MIGCGSTQYAKKKLVFCDLKENYLNFVIHITPLMIKDNKNQKNILYLQ